MRHIFKNIKEVQHQWLASKGDESWGESGSISFRNGKHVVDKGCLESHLKEQYIHGTLIVNALTDNHIDRPDIVWRSNLRDIMVRSVRRYFKKYLCI